MNWQLHLEKNRVQQELRWFKRHPRYLERLSERLQTYLPYLYQQTQLRDMPAELALLPVIESALDSYAFSHGGAAGPWQFIRGTARQYGLDINSWYDGRRDIIAATDAALNYLSDLHQRYDDWYLALAGYNAGQGNVDRALQRNSDATFFDLSLPRETRAYVPRLLALVAVVKDPHQYGLELPELRSDNAFAVLDTYSQFQLDKLAVLSGLDLDEVLAWNPALNQWATPPGGPHRIIVPAHLNTDAIQTAISSVPQDQRVDWLEVKVKRGDTLSQIARRHGMDVASIRMANGLPDSRIRAGQTLLVPAHRQVQSTALARVTSGATYTVRSGDSLWTIARAHQVSLKNLMAVNQVGPRDPLAIGRQLTIPGAAAGSDARPTPRSVTRKVKYKVRRGDSLARIAGKFNVSVPQLVAWNKLDIDRYLQPGQALSVYVDVLSGR